MNGDTAGACAAFCERVLKDNAGKPLRNAPLHQSWHAHIEHCWETSRKHPVIFAPWGHGKTVQVVLGRVLHALGVAPELRVKIICNAKETAQQRVVALAQYVEYDEELHAEFEHLRRPKTRRSGGWTQSRFSLAADGDSRKIDPSVQGDGILSTGIGGRADLIVFDDVVDRRNALDNPKLLRKVIDNYFETWLSRLDGLEGRSITIMTLWHRDDLGHALMENEEFCVLKQAVNDELTAYDCELFNADAEHPLLAESLAGDERFLLPLWEAHWPREALLRKKRENVRAFERGFQQKAFTAEEVMFPSFRKCFVDLTREEVLGGSS